ncbi:MAG: nucleotide exchange factor GrpE [Phycisphaerales bacterium]|jgi:molecular chaperone GrpE|nr:nucleotide exchange factor GrpE [Phycisphaerales bacterium]
MFNPFKKDKADGSTPGSAAQGEGAGEGLGEGAEGVDGVAPGGEGEVEQLQAQIAQLRADLGQAQDDRQRALADYVNFQRRSVQNERDAREAGVRNVLHSVLPVIDHFDMALGQDPEKASAKSVIDGVTMIKDELIRVLGVHGVTAIRPNKGDAFDPAKHKAIAQHAAEGVAPGAVVALARAGYMINDRIVRPAEVVVAPEVAAAGA